MSVSVDDYLDSADYLRDVAAIGVLKKYPDLPYESERRAKAIEKWYQGEAQCYKSNERLARYLPVSGFSSHADRNECVSSFLEDCGKMIVQWIGTRPPKIEHLEGRFGPGGTYNDRRQPTVADKMTSVPTLTHDAWPYLFNWIGTSWATAVAEHHGKVEFVRGNRFTTVPKTAEIDRAIASEPSLNIFFQLALGRVMRQRLRANAGWDLDRAADIHRKVAKDASVSREFATLDLSNASDTVSRNLVRILLPRFWVEELESLRSPRTFIEKKWVVLEKFSSMGNGFTFELETLIFAALACVVSQRCGHKGQLGVDVFVFGDDIIVKDDVTHPLKSALEFCGFALNSNKSYWGDSPFRESCGGDYFDGKPVRPYHLKDSLDGPQDIIAFANGLHALRERLAENGYALRLRAWHALLDFLPSRLRCLRGPKRLGDTVIHDEESRWARPRLRNGILWAPCFRPHRKRIRAWGRYPEEVVLACATYGTGGGLAGGLTPRDSIQSYKVGWVSVS